MNFLGQIHLVVIVIQGAARESAVVPMGASPSATIKMMMLVVLMIRMMMMMGDDYDNVDNDKKVISP